MSDFNDLIHDAWQVDLEEAIKMNETLMYLVPGRLTDEIQQKIARRIQPRSERDFSDAELELIWVMAGSAFAAVQEISTPIQPCADVETVGYAHGKYLSAGHAYKMINPITRSIKRVDAHFDTALIRRTDMEAQVARVAAEKDAEIEKLRKENEALKNNCVKQTINHSTYKQVLQLSRKQAGVIIGFIELTKMILREKDYLQTQIRTIQGRRAFSLIISEATSVADRFALAEMNETTIRRICKEYDAEALNEGAAG